MDNKTAGILYALSVLFLLLSVMGINYSKSSLTTITFSIT